MEKENKVKAVSIKHLLRDSMPILKGWMNACGVPKHKMTEGCYDMYGGNIVNVCVISDYEDRRIFEQLLERATRLDDVGTRKFWEKRLNETRYGVDLRLVDILEQ